MKAYIAVPAMVAIVYRAYSRKSLTHLGLLVAIFTATIHALHPWSLPFALLGVFFLGGTAATKVKHDVKSSLTLSSSGTSGGETPRTHIQVLANSGCASILILLHIYQLSHSTLSSSCLAYGNDLLIVGIISNYAAVAADTFSSELGILSRSPPRLITTLQPVPPGTNGGVTLAGLVSGLLGSTLIAITSLILLPFCPPSPGPVSLILTSNEYRGWTVPDKLLLTVFIALWGLLGSILDSFLGALLQASVVDRHTGKVVEGDGGVRVLVRSGSHTGHGPAQRQLDRIQPPKSQDGSSSRHVLTGRDWLDNNQINFLMAALMSVGGMGVVGWYWRIPLSSIINLPAAV